MKRWFPLLLLAVGCEESFLQNWPLSYQTNGYIISSEDTTLYITSSEPDTAQWDTLWMVCTNHGITTETGGSLPQGVTSERRTIGFTDTALGPVLELNFFNREVNNGYQSVVVARTGVSMPTASDTLPPGYSNDAFQDTLVIGQDTLPFLQEVGQDPRFYLRRGQLPKAIVWQGRIFHFE